MRLFIGGFVRNVFFDSSNKGYSLYFIERFLFFFLNGVI